MLIFGAFKNGSKSFRNQGEERRGGVGTPHTALWQKGPHIATWGVCILAAGVLPRSAEEFVGLWAPLRWPSAHRPVNSGPKFLLLGVTIFSSALSGVAPRHPVAMGPCAPQLVLAGPFPTPPSAKGVWNRAAGFQARYQSYQQSGMRAPCPPPTHS